MCYNIMFYVDNLRITFPVTILYSAVWSIWTLTQRECEHDKFQNL